MKNLIRNISLLILISLGFSSCIYDNYPDSDSVEGHIDPNTTILYLDLRALNPSTMTMPVEKIKTVRVIIIGEEVDETDSDPAEETDGGEGTETVAGIVEYNRLYQFPASNASSFSYTVTWPSKLGPKSVYVIANEESVGRELTDRLNQYTEMAEAGDLETWLGGYSFVPKYTTTDNNIYLPYTFSKTGFVPSPAKVNTVNCWLVPVATKFVFHFQNKRDNPVKINGISMASANSKSYVLPHIAQNAQYMEYGGELLYWPDWLAIVSQSSWDYPEFGENEGFNSQYGWITAYSVPDPSDSDVYTFIAEDSEDVFTVPAAQEITTEEGKETVASTHTTPIFYLPESIHYRLPDDVTSSDSESDNEEKEEQQMYYLTINLEDLGGGGKAPKFENVPIPNLNALFRNTFVVIQMVMGQGDIMIYAEIAPWNIVSSNGWVSEGNSGPSNNPFAIRKR